MIYVVISVALFLFVLGLLILWPFPERRKPEINGHYDDTGRWHPWTEEYRRDRRR